MRVLPLQSVLWRATLLATRLVVVPESLKLTAVYEDGDDGWIVASVPEIPGVLSQGRDLDEARHMIRSALADWLRWYVEDQQPQETPPPTARREQLEVVIAS